MSLTESCLLSTPPPPARPLEPTSIVQKGAKETGWLGGKGEGELLRASPLPQTSSKLGLRGRRDEIPGGERRREGGDLIIFSANPSLPPARQTASSPARAGAADKYLKLRPGGRVGGRLGLRAPRRRRRGIRQGCRASLKSTKQKWEGAARRVAAQGGRVPRADLLPGALWTRRGRLAGKGAPSGICAGPLRLGTARCAALPELRIQGVDQEVTLGRQVRVPLLLGARRLGRVAGTHPGEVLLKGAQCMLRGLGSSP